MSRPSKCKRRKQDNLSKARYALKLTKMWNERFVQFDEYDLGNSKGRTRTTEENKLVLLTLKLVLKLYLEKVESKELKPHELSWTLVENRVASGLQMRREHVTKLRQQLWDNDSVGSFGNDLAAEVLQQQRQQQNYPTNN
jgi:hypothetical protein